MFALPVTASMDLLVLKVSSQIATKIDSILMEYFVSSI